MSPREDPLSVALAMLIAFWPLALAVLAAVVGVVVVLRRPGRSRRLRVSVAAAWVLVLLVFAYVATGYWLSRYGIGTVFLVGDCGWSRGLALAAELHQTGELEVPGFFGLREGGSLDRRCGRTPSPATPTPAPLPLGYP